MGEEEIYCEEHLRSKYKRGHTSGLKLPIEGSAVSVLGSSKEIAVRRLKKLWFKLDKNKTIANLYTAFMGEYEFVGHMTQVKVENTKGVS